MEDTMFGLIREDFRQKTLWCYESDRWPAVVRALFTDGTAATVLYRLMQWSRRWRLVPLELAFNNANAVFCHRIIGRGAEFGEGFALIYSMGVVINGGVKGGRGVRIEHQVTIGADRRRAPTIGDGVFLGAGAKVLGSVTIGDGARVGANAVVVTDIPSHCTAVGVPARIVRRRTPPTGAISPADFADLGDDPGYCSAPVANGSVP
jgi:serine O-acetyltransferase